MPGQGVGENAGAVFGQDLGGVLTGRQGEGVRVRDAGLEQQVVGCAGGLDTGRVVLQRDDDAAVGERRTTPGTTPRSATPTPPLPPGGPPGSTTRLKDRPGEPRPQAADIPR